MSQRGSCRELKRQTNSNSGLNRDGGGDGGALAAEDTTEQAGELSREDLAADGARRVTVDRAPKAAANLRLGLTDLLEVGWYSRNGDR